MKQHRQTNAWVLLCSVIVITVVATEHSSHHNGLPYHGGAGHRRKNPHEPTGTAGLQIPEPVMSHPDVSCISTDKNIFEIMNKAKISCQGNDMVCTFYIYKDHRYYNLGSLEIKKDKFDHLLRKYDNWLLTAGKIENRKDTGRKHDKVNDLSAVDTANVKVENVCDNAAQIDSQEVKNMPDYYRLNIDTSNMSDVLDVSKENYIKSTGENQSQTNNNKENTVTLIKVEEKQGKKGNYMKLKPKYDKEHKYYEVFLPKDKNKGKTRTLNVDINKDNKNLFFEEGDNDIHTDTLENRRNVNSPSFTNNSEHEIPNEVANNNIENLTPLGNLKDVIQNQICHNLKKDTLATSYSNPESNLRQDFYVEGDTKTREVLHVLNPNICNFNANQKLMVGDNGEKVKSIVNLSHNVCVPDKYANYAEYYVESQLNNDCNRKMLTGDTPTNNNFDKNNDKFKDNNLNLPSCNIVGSDTNLNDTLENVPLNNPCDEHIYNPHDFDETHDVSMHHNDSFKISHIHINEPIFKLDHTHEHDLDQPESIADRDHSLNPNDPSSNPSLPVCTASDLTAGSSQISELDPECRLPTLASNIPYLSPILPAPPLENIMVLNMGSEKSPCNAGFSWLPSYSRIKGLRLPSCKARPISSEPATPIPQSNIQDPNKIKAVTDSLEALSPIVKSTVTRDDYVVQTDCTNPFDCKIGVNTPCPVQEISQAPTSLIGPSLKDLGNINYSSFEQIPIFNEQENMISPSPKIISPCVCVPSFVQPYLKSVYPNLIPTPYYYTTENYSPCSPVETIRNLDYDCSQNIAQLPSQSLIQKSPIIPCLQNPQLCLGPCFCGIPICPFKPFTVANTPCYDPLPVPCSPYTCVSDNGFKNVPSSLNTNGVLLQNQILEALEAVPCLKEEYPYLDMDVNKNIISEQKPLSNSVYTSPDQTNLINSFPALVNSNHLPKFLNSIPVLDTDVAKFVQIPETKIISGNSVKPELDTSQNRLPVKVLDSSLIGPNLYPTSSIPNDSLNGENIQSICYGSPSESDLDDLIPLDSSLTEPELGLDISPLTTDYRPPQYYYNRPKLPGNILPSSLIPPSLFDQPSSTIPNLKTNNSKQLKLKLNKLPFESNLQTDDFIQLSEAEANRYQDEYSSLLVKQNHQLPSEFTGSTGTLITTDVFNQPSIVSPILNKPRHFPESVKPFSGLTTLPSENIQFLSPSQLDKGISKTSPVSYSEISQYRPSLSSLDYTRPQSYIKYVTPQNFISEISADSIEIENRTPMIPLSASESIMTPMKLTPKNPTLSLTNLTGPSLSELPSSSELLPSVPCTLSSFDNLTPITELPEAQEILLWSEIKDILGGHSPSNEICSPQIPLTASLPNLYNTPLTPLSKLLPLPPICTRPVLGKYGTLHTPQYSYLPSSYVNPTFMPQRPMSVPIQESYISPSELAALLPSSLNTSPTLNLNVQSPRPQLLSPCSITPQYSLPSYVDTSEVSVPTSQYSILPQKSLSHAIPLESLPISTYTNPIEAESILSEPYHKLLSTLGPELKALLEQSISLSHTPCQGLPLSPFDTPKFIPPSFRRPTNILQENLPLYSYPAVCPYAPNIPLSVHNSPISPLSFKPKPQFSYTPSELLYPCDELLAAINEAQPVEIKPLKEVSLKPCNAISPQLNIPICPPKSISPYIEPSSYVPLLSPDLISDIPLSDFTSLKPVSSSRPVSFTSETLPVPICDTTPLNVLDEYYELPTATPTIKGQPCIDLSSALTPETILESPTLAQIRPLDADYQIFPNSLLPFTSLPTAPVSYQSPVSGIFTPHPIAEFPKNLPCNLPMPIASESPFVLIRPTINPNWQISPLSKPPSISPIPPVCITPTNILSPDKNITPFVKDLPLTLDSFICNDDHICLDDFRPLLDENTLELLKDMSFWPITPTSIAPAIPSADYTVPGKLKCIEYLSQANMPSTPFVPYNQLFGEDILSPYIVCKESNVSPTKHRPITPLNLSSAQTYLPSTLPIQVPHSSSSLINIPEYHIADSSLLGESILPIEDTKVLTNPKFSKHPHKYIPKMLSSYPYTDLPSIDNPLQITDINSLLDTESFQNILSPTTCDSLNKLVPNISPETIASDLHSILDADVTEMRPLLPSPRPIIPSSLYPNPQPIYPIIHPQIHHPIMYPQRIPYQQQRPLNLQPCMLPAQKLLDQELLQIIDTLPDIVHSPYIPKKKNQLSSSLIHMPPSTTSDAFETKGPCPVLPYSESNDIIVLEPVTQLTEDDIRSLISSDISNVELRQLTNLLPQYKLPLSQYIHLPFSPETSSIPSLSPLESRPPYSRLFPITETIKSTDFQPSEIQNILKLLESMPSSELDAESLQEILQLSPHFSNGLFETNSRFPTTSIVPQYTDISPVSSVFTTPLPFKDATLIPTLPYAASTAYGRPLSPAITTPDLYDSVSPLLSDLTGPSLSAFPTPLTVQGRPLSLANTKPLLTVSPNPSDLTGPSLTTYNTPLTVHPYEPTSLSFPYKLTETKPLSLVNTPLLPVSSSPLLSELTGPSLSAFTTPLALHPYPPVPSSIQYELSEARPLSQANTKLVSPVSYSPLPSELTGPSLSSFITSLTMHPYEQIPSVPFDLSEATLLSLADTGFPSPLSTELTGPSLPSFTTPLTTFPYEQARPLSQENTTPLVPVSSRPLSSELTGPSLSDFTTPLTVRPYEPTPSSIPYELLEARPLSLTDTTSLLPGSPSPLPSDLTGPSLSAFTTPLAVRPFEPIPSSIEARPLLLEDTTPLLPGYPRLLPSGLIGPSLLASTTPLTVHPYAPTSIYTKPSSIPYKLSDALQSKVLPDNYIPLSLDDCSLLSPEYLNQKTLTSHSSSTLTSPIFAGNIGPTPQIVYDSESPLISTVTKPLAPGYTKPYPQIYNGPLLPLSVNPFSPRYGHFPLSPPSLLEHMSPSSPALQILNENQLIPINYHPPRRPLTSLVQNPCEIVSPQTQLEPSNILQYSDVTNSCINADQWLPITPTTSSQRYPTYKPQLLVSKPIDSSTPIDINNLLNIIPEKEIWSNAQPALKSLKLEKPTYSNQDNICENNNLIYQDIREAELKPLLESLTKILEADKTGSVVDRDFSQYVEVMPSLPVPTLCSVPIRESKLYQRPCLSPYSPIYDSPIFTSPHPLPITLAPSIQASPYVLPMKPSAGTLKSVPALVTSSPFIKPLPASPEFINPCYSSASIVPPYTHLSPLTDIEKILSESQLPYKILPEHKKLQLTPAMSIQKILSPEEIQSLIAAQTPRISSSPYLSYKPIDTVSIPTDFSRFPAISPSVAIPIQSLTMPLNSVSSPIKSIEPQLIIPNICDSYIPRSPTYTKKLNTPLYQGLPIGPSPVLIHDVPATYAKPLQNIDLPLTSTMSPQYLPLSSPALTLQESNYYPCSVMNEVPLYPQRYTNPSTKIHTPINIKSNILKNPPKFSNPCLQSYTEVPSSTNIGSPYDLIEADTIVINRPQKFLTPTEQYSLPTKLKLSPLTILPNAVPITGIPLETIDSPKYIPCSAKQPITYNSLSYLSPFTLDSEYLTLPTSKVSPLLNIPGYSVTPLSYPVNEETVPCYPCNIPLKQPIKANSYNQYKVPLQPLQLPTSYLPELSPCIQYPVQSLQKLSPVPCQYTVPSSSASFTPLLAPNISPNYQIAEPYLPQPCRSNIPAYSSPIQKYSSLVNPFINPDFESVPVKPLSPILNKSVPLLKVTPFDTIVPTPYTYPLDISQAITPEYITTTVPLSPLHSSSLVKSLTNSVFSPKLSTQSLAPISPLSPISYLDSQLTPCLLSPSSLVLKSPLLRPLLINSQNAVPLPSPYTNLNKELPKIGPTPIIANYNECAPLTSTKLAKDLPSIKPCITPYSSTKSSLTEQLLSPIPCLPLSPISKSLSKLVEPRYETVLPEPILTQSNPYTTKPLRWNSPLTSVIPLYDDLKPLLVNSEPYTVPHKQLPSYAPYYIPQTCPSALLKTNIVKDINPVEYLQSKSSLLPLGLPPEIETILTNYDQYISNKKYPKLPLAVKQQSKPRHSTLSPLTPYSDLITNNFSPYETLTPFIEIPSYRLPIASKAPSISPIKAKFVDATDYISKAPTTSKPSPEFAEYLPLETSPIDTIAPIPTDTPSNILPLKYLPSEIIPDKVSSYPDLSKYRPANILKTYTEIPSLINNLSKVLKPSTPEELLEVEPVNFVTPKTPKLSIPLYAEYIDTEKVNKYYSKITSAETENVRLGAKPVIVDAQSVTDVPLKASKVNKAGVNIENYINGEFEVPQFVPISLAPNRLGRPDLAKGPDNVSKYAPYVPNFSPTGNNIPKHSKPIPHYSRPISHKPKNTLKYGDFYANNHIGKSPEVVNIPAKINYDTLPANSNTNTIIPYNTVSPEICDDFITIPLKTNDLVTQLEVANLKLDEGYTETPYNPIEDAIPCTNSQDILKPCPELNPVTYSPLLDIPNEISNAKPLSPTLQAIRPYPMKFLQQPCEVTEILEPPTSYTPYEEPKTIKYSGYKTYLNPASKTPNKYQIPCPPCSPLKNPYTDIESTHSILTPDICAYYPITTKNIESVPKLKATALKPNVKYDEVPCESFENAIINSLKPCIKFNPETTLSPYPVQFIQQPCKLTEIPYQPALYTPCEDAKTIKYSGYKTYLNPAPKIPNKYQMPCLPLTDSPFKIPCANTKTAYSIVTPENPKVPSSLESPYSPVKIPYKDIKSPEIYEFTSIPTENIDYIPKLKATALTPNVKYEEIPCEPCENTITNILKPCIKPKPEILSPYPEQYLQTPKEITGALPHLSSNSPLEYLKIPQVDTTKPCNIVPAEICNDFTTTPTKNVDTVSVFDTASQPNAGYTEIPCKPIKNLPITSNFQAIVSPYIKKNPVPCSPYPMQFLQYPCEVTRTPYNPTSYNPCDNTVNNKYVGYKTYINPASKTPCIPPTQKYSPCIIPQSLSPIPQYAKPILSTPIQYQSPIQNDLITTPCQTEFSPNDEQQSPKLNAYSPIEDVEVCKSYKEIENELKSSLVKYINSKEAVKSDLYNNCNELTIPIGDLAIANKEPRNDNTIATDNPSIGLKVWKSKVKILKAELKLKFKQFSVNNFMPVVNNLDEYDVEEIRKIIKSYIDEKYGSHIEVNEPYSVDNQYTVLNDFNFDAVNNQFNILWPPNYV